MVAEPPELVALLRQRELDVIVTDDSGFCGDQDLSGLLVEPLFQDALFAALPRDHRLASRETIRLVDLREDDWVLVALPGEGEGPGNLVLRACRDAGFEPRVVFSSVEYFALGGLIASGAGVGLLPGLALATLRSDIVVRPLHGFPPTRRVAVVTDDPRSSEAVTTIVDCLHAASEPWGRYPDTVLEAWARAAKDQSSLLAC
jgi:DNA-binding transcriptional LysR family regulator